MRNKAIWVLGLLALALLLASCAPNASQSTLDPAGQPAQSQKDLFVPVFWVAVAVFVIVEGLIVLILIKYRHRKNQERLPKQTHGNTRLEIGWTIVPAVVLAFVMIPTVSLIWDLARPPGPDAMHVTVQGYQWWWGFQYTDPDMTVDYAEGKPLRIADVLVVPVDREVYLTLESQGGQIGGDPYQRDYQVIHSFWTPRLFGKQDVVPGQENHITFTADEPGTYTGQCAEFCGLEHGRMRFRVRVLSQSDWDTWVAAHKQGAVDPTDPLAKQGKQIFFGTLPNGGSCITCHAIGGTEATSEAAPDLTDYADPSHQCFAGCNWNVYNADGSLNTEDLAAWLHDPNAVKLGAKMPNYHLTEDQIQALIAYLGSLK